MSLHRVNQQSLNSGQSNYMVSNDGVQIMDLPGTTAKMRKGQSSGRTTPIIIPPLKYIVYNNPQVVYDFLISKGYTVDNRIPSVYQFARVFVKERGDEGIMELIRVAHPDKDLILRSTGHKDDSSFCCGFNGENQPSPGSTKSAEQQTTTQELKNEASGSAKEKTGTEKTDGGGIKINTQTIIIILVIIVFFLLINRATR